jgi:purine-binding chemotaxis protein CheW
MSSKQAHKLSGAQALDEYFTSLLDEEWEFADDTSLTSSPSVSLVAVESEELEQTVATRPEPELELEVQPQADYSSYAELRYSEVEVPDLDDVQKLLDKMETTDLAAEPAIADLIEKNAEIIQQAEVDIPVSDPVIEEIQEWEVENDVESLTGLSSDEELETAVDEPEVVSEEIVESETELETELSASQFDDWTSTERDVDFQVLYFDVNGITFAVPLDELGGIHRVGEMSHLIGRPDWYLGLQTNKDQQYDVVDTAKWVMTNRLKDESHKDAYHYIVMLGDSSWGLAATELKGTESLNVESVRWRAQAGKRPWLAGMVKEKMCALIHVEAMITMITAGLDVKSLDS